MTTFLFGKIATPGDIKPRIAMLSDLLEAQRKSVLILAADFEQSRSEELAAYLVTPGAAPHDEAATAINQKHDARAKRLTLAAQQNLRPLQAMIRFFTLCPDGKPTIH